jgi:hypothetical protein
MLKPQTGWEFLRPADCQSAKQQIANLRYGVLRLGA